MNRKYSRIALVVICLLGGFLSGVGLRGQNASGEDSKLQQTKVGLIQHIAELEKKFAELEKTIILNAASYHNQVAEGKHRCELIENRLKTIEAKLRID